MQPLSYSDRSLTWVNFLGFTDTIIYGVNNSLASFRIRGSILACGIICPRICLGSLITLNITLRRLYLYTYLVGLALYAYIRVFQKRGFSNVRVETVYCLRIQRFLGTSAFDNLTFFGSLFSIQKYTVNQKN